MKKFRTLLTSLIVLLCALTTSAHDFEVDGIYCKITSSSDLTVAVTYRGSKYDSYNEYSSSVVIPEKVTYNSKEYSVTSIGNSAFRGCSGLTSVTIPNSVISIENYAFSGCTSLTSVDIPNSVTSIGENAFDGCKNLTSLTIPNSVTNIEDNTFSNCSRLKNITIGNSVTNIGYEAFLNCSKLTDITIPNSVTNIEARAFWNCSMLRNLKIEDGENPIRLQCNYLASVGYEGSGLFSNCRIVSLYLGRDINYYTDLNAGYSPFYNQKDLVHLTIGKYVTKIKSYTFYGCSSLESVNIPNSVTSIGVYAFFGCSSLTSIIIPNSVTTIKDKAFAYCSELTSVTLGNSITSIGIDVFSFSNIITRIDCMATTPPLVYSNTFSSSIYTNATLNVPKGCAEAYQKADYWKKFIKITSDNQDQCAAPVITYADGKLQFACETAGAEYMYTLTASDAKSSFEKSAGSVGLTACYDITAYAVAEGYKNSEQVTATLYWINSSDVSTNINQTEMRGIMAACSGGIITVSGLSDGETVMFYNANGALLYTGTAQNGTISYAPSASGVIIVKIGTASIKVVK